MKRGIALVVALACLLAAPGAAAAPPNTDWTSFLPALQAPNEAQPGPVTRCKRATLRCVNRTARLMRKIRDRLGCDHRAVFATTYLVLTRAMRQAIRAEPELFRNPRYLYRQVAAFANVYFRTVWMNSDGEDVPEAWQIAFDTARHGEVNAAQDMLLGINAHVQNDMPFVLAALGIRTRRDFSRKPDHDAANEVLNRAYDRVVRAVAWRYDPYVRGTNAEEHPVDDVAGLEMVRTWRETVWRNAERLVNADSEAERRRIAEEIEAHAAGWARGIASFQSPGDRERRARWCNGQLG